MKVSQAHRATITILHLLLISVCQSSVLPEQTTNPTSSSPLSKREISMVCSGLLPASQHNYPGGLFAGRWESLQDYCEQRPYGPSCACFLLQGGAAPEWVVRCVPNAHNARFMHVRASDACRQLCTCQDLPERSPPETEKPGPRPNVLEPAAVGGLGRAGVR